MKAELAEVAIVDMQTVALAGCGLNGCLAGRELCRNCNLLLVQIAGRALAKIAGHRVMKREAKSA